MGWSKVQTVANNNGAVAATTVVGNLASTQQGTLLFAAICCAVANAVITPPAGWVQMGVVQQMNPSGGSVAIFRYEQNPGSITTVTFTITSSLASIVISEYANPTMPTSSFNDYGIFANPNGTAASFGGAQTLGGPILKETGELWIAVIGLIATAAPTLSNTGVGLTIDGQAITTAGSGNAVVFLLSNLNSPSSTFNSGSTLSATPTNGPSCFSAAFLTFLLLANNGFVNAPVQAQGVFL